MKKLFALLLALLMLVPCLALGESYTLREAAVPCAYDAIWLSASPSGRYLIGVNNEGGDLQSAVLLYETETGACTPLPIEVEEGSDAHKAIQRMLASPANLKALQVIWAPDEMHFVFTYTETLMRLQGLSGLHVGSIREKKITTPASWLGKATKAGGGLMAHAGFSADSTALYYMVYGKAYESQYQMMKYDLATGRNTPLFSCLDEMDGERISYVFRALIGVNDDLFILDLSSRSGGFAILRRENGEWQRQLFLQEGNQTVQRLEYSPESGYGMVLTRSNQANPYAAYVFRMDEAGNLLSMEQFLPDQEKEPALQDKVINFALSPDGQYAMLAIQEMGPAGRIEMLKLDDLSLTPVSVPEEIESNVQAWGFNVPVAPVSVGYSWGGEYVIGGLGRSSALLKFAGVGKAGNEHLAQGAVGVYEAVYAEMGDQRVNMDGTNTYSTIELMEDGRFTIILAMGQEGETYQGEWQLYPASAQDGEQGLLLTVDGDTLGNLIGADFSYIKFGAGAGMLIYYQRQQ